MDAAEGWNDPDDYSLFLPEDAFNLFGELGFPLEFSDLLASGFDEANTAFDCIEWERHEITAQHLHYPSSMVEPSECAVNSPEPMLLRSKEAFVSTREPVQGTNAKAKPTADTTEGIEPDEKCEAKATGSKRKYLKAFSAESGEEVPLHSRKPFSEQRRKIVALNRMIGVCIHCRLRKVACNSGLPCDQCIKRAGGVYLGQKLCMRRSLVETRFDSIDLIPVAILENEAKQLNIPADAKIDRWAYIWFANDAEMDVPEAYIMIPVVPFERPNFRPSRIALSMDYYHMYEHVVSDTKHAIAPEYVPSLECLLQAYLVSRRGTYLDLGPFAGLQKAFREFVECYCKIPGKMPLKELLSKILQLQRLFDIYRTMPSIKASPCTQEGDFVSSSIWLQLRLPICKAILALEADVLTEIDRMIQSKDGIGRQNPLATWASLWILLFSYKEHMVFTKAWSRFGSDKIYSLNQHMYNMLTSTHAALYKTTSPLTLDWRSKDVADMMGNDSQLINLFCNIKTEMFWFQGDRDRLFPEDALFKTLVVGNESKLVTAHIKAAKRQGFL